MFIMVLDDYEAFGRKLKDTINLTKGPDFVKTFYFVDGLSVICRDCYGMLISDNKQVSSFFVSVSLDLDGETYEFQRTTSRKALDCKRTLGEAVDGLMDLVENPNEKYDRVCDKWFRRHYGDSPVNLTAA